MFREVKLARQMQLLGQLQTRFSEAMRTATLQQRASAWFLLDADALWKQFQGQPGHAAAEAIGSASRDLEAASQFLSRWEAQASDGAHAEVLDSVRRIQRALVDFVAIIEDAEESPVEKTIDDIEVYRTTRPQRRESSGQRTQAAKASRGIGVPKHVVVLALVLLLSIPVLRFRFGPNYTLFDAIERGDRPTVEALLEKGADPNAKQFTGMPALLFAVTTKNQGVSNLLIERGANVNEEHAVLGTPLALSAQFGLTEVIRALLAKGARVNDVRKTDGHTALMVAVESGETEAAKLLMAQGAATDLKAADGRTASDLARGNAAMTALLAGLEAH